MKLYLAAYLAYVSQTPSAVSAATVRGNDRGNQPGSGRGPPTGGKPPPTDDNEKSTYILTFANRNESSSKRCEALAKANGGHNRKTFNKVLNGCSMDLSPQRAEALRRNPNISRIEMDQEVFALDVPSVASGADFSTDAWGLDRVNECERTLDGVATKQDASGVKVYVLDTGIHGDHEDFVGLIDLESTCHKSSVDYDPLDDANGHGTHVASTACGKTYGVASNCVLCSVRVFVGNSGWTEDIIEGVEHAAENCGGARCVMNLSLGGPYSEAMNEAVANAVVQGITVVVAAGNSNVDACSSSPASEPGVITVGATDNSDVRSWFSNYGSCVDIYAPGSSILAAETGGGITTKSGTSMASPHVAGLAAGILGKGAYSPAEVAAHLVGTAYFPTQDIEDGQQGVATAGCGTLPPTFSPKPTPGPTPTPAPTPTPTCAPGHAKLEVDTTTDNYPGETQWELINECTGDKVMFGGSYQNARTLYSAAECMPEAKYMFTISDSYGDGICCDYGTGSYAVTYDGSVVADGGDFMSSETTTFGSCPPPTSAPTTTSAPTICDGQYLIVNVKTDDNASSSSWKLTDSCGDNVVVASVDEGFYTDGANIISSCVPISAYTFEFFQEGQVSYEVSLNGEMVVDSSFCGEKQATSFGVSCQA